MALFENFPYTNLHELNLDWLINALKRMEETQVLSVNGQTGDVILYQDPDVILPAIQNAVWSFFRDAAGTVRGITFDENGNAFIMNGEDLYKVYTDHNSADVDAQYIQLPSLTDEQIYNWNIFRSLNGTISGIQFDDDGTAYIMSGLNRYKVYSQHDAPPYPVTSVNGQTGAVVLYPDAQVRLPDVNDNDVDYWNIFRWVNNGYYGIQFNTDDDTIDLITPGQRTKIYTAADQPPYPVTSVNGQTGIVSLNIPPDFVVDLDDEYLDVATDVNGYGWGLTRVTQNGSIGISFDNQNGNKAFIRYFDSNLQDDVEVQLLTIADIPSSAGVSSINGLSGVVTLYGNQIERTNVNNQTVDQGLSNLEAEALKTLEEIAILVNTDYATQAITSGQYVIVTNSTITGITDGIYKAANNVSANTSLTSADLTAITNGGLNDLLDVLDTFKTLVNTVETDSVTNNGVTAALRKRDRIASITISTGKLTNAVSAAGTILTIPSGYRPIVTQLFLGLVGTTVVRYTINPNGTLTCNTALAADTAVRLTWMYMI